MLIIDKRKAMAVAPILRLGFRPFFLLGAVLAALAIPLWIAALQGWALPALGAAMVRRPTETS